MNIQPNWFLMTAPSCLKKSVGVPGGPVGRDVFSAKTLIV